MNELVYLLLCLIIVYAGIKLLQFVKDVPDLYLNEQSVIEPVRLSQESSIYHSNKSFGLRSGLDIRYDSYKLRSGNLNDIWEIVINNVRNGTDEGITISGETVKFGELNSILKSIHFDGPLRISRHGEFNLKSLLVLLYGFINQITVEVGNSITEFDIPDHDYDLDFENEYTPMKDKGIALLYRDDDTVIEFTQLNLISAVASTIKHLPVSFNMNQKSMLLLPPETNTNEEISNFIVKLLVGFVNNCSIEINSKFDPKFDIISLNESQLPFSELKLYQIPFYHLINIGIFPYKSKLMYINNSMGKKPIFTASQLNKLKVLYNCRIIKELGYYNIIGPVILTDFFEHRTFSNLFGCIFQSLEIKLVNFVNVGNLSIRGYTIGKTTKHNHFKSKDNQGFMNIEIKGKWGKDGCLYIQQ